LYAVPIVAVVMGDPLMTGALLLVVELFRQRHDLASDEVGAVTIVSTMSKAPKCRRNCMSVTL